MNGKTSCFEGLTKVHLRLIDTMILPHEFWANYAIVTSRLVLVWSFLQVGCKVGKSRDLDDLHREVFQTFPELQWLRPLQLQEVYSRWTRARLWLLPVVRHKCPELLQTVLGIFFLTGAVNAWCSEC